jgi:hypothetical protein
VGTSLRLRRYLARVSGVSQDTLLRAVSGLSEAASSAPASYYRRVRLAGIHRVEVAFPLGTPEPPLNESRTPPWSPLRAYVALEKLVAFRKGQRPIRRRRSAKNYRLETHRRYRRWAVRGPRCFPSCRFTPSPTIARRTRRDRPPCV